MNETEWYTSDLFGLKTANEAGKIHFERVHQEIISNLSRNHLNI